MRWLVWLLNKVENKKYNLNETEADPLSLVPCDEKTLKNGDKVYVKSISSYAVVDSINAKKGECFVSVGSMRMSVKTKDILVSKAPVKAVQPKASVKISTQISTGFKNEINVIGLNREEALDKVITFIDAAVLNNAEEIRIVHGKGQKILSTAIHALLRKTKHVASFRFGQYGEGENGVTIVTLK